MFNVNVGYCTLFIYFILCKKLKLYFWVAYDISSIAKVLFKNRSVKHSSSLLIPHLIVLMQHKHPSKAKAFQCCKRWLCGYYFNLLESFAIQGSQTPFIFVYMSYAGVNTSRFKMFRFYSCVIPQAAIVLYQQTELVKGQ